MVCGATCVSRPLTPGFWDRDEAAATADHPENLQGKGEVLNTGNGHASGADERSAPRIGDQAGEWKYNTDTDGARGQEMHVLPPGEGARIAIVTMYFGSSLYLKEITGPNKAIYAKQHGYDFFDAYENAQVRALVDEVVAKGTPNDLLFVKLKGILHFLPDYDWVRRTNCGPLLSRGTGSDLTWRSHRRSSRSVAPYGFPPAQPGFLERCRRIVPQL